MTSASDRRRQLEQRGGTTPSQGRFTYQRRDTDTLAQRTQTYAQGGRDNYVESTIQTFTPQKGDNWLRILPPTWDNPKHYGHDVWVHYGIGPDRLAYLCLEKNGKGDCPICLERAELARKGLEEAASELRPTYRIAVYIIDRKATEKGVMLWTMPMRIDQELVTLTQDKRTGEILWIDDPYQGYDIEFTRSGEGIHTQYSGVRIGRNPSPLDNDVALDFAIKHPIPGIFIYSTPEVIEKALSGQPAGQRPSSGEGGSAPAPQRAQLSRPSASAAPLAAPPSRSKLSPDQLLDVALKAADTHNIDIPDSVPDEKVAEHVAGKLGDRIKDYPDLEGPF